MSALPNKAGTSHQCIARSQQLALPASSQPKAKHQKLLGRAQAQSKALQACQVARALRRLFVRRHEKYHTLCGWTKTEQSRAEMKNQIYKPNWNKNAEITE
jgi:hypothetical protein